MSACHDQEGSRRRELPLRIGISSCLLGERVRYDGGHKAEPLLIRELGSDVEWVPVCPEVESGMGVPREPVNLIASPGEESPRMIAAGTGRDWTDAMTAHAEKRALELAALGLSGYILKSRSPSCGLEAPVRSRRGDGVGAGPGLFAAALSRCIPRLPIEEESRLRDPEILALFRERVRAYHRELSAGGQGPRGL